MFGKLVGNLYESGDGKVLLVSTPFGYTVIVNGVEQEGWTFVAEPDGSEAILRFATGYQAVLARRMNWLRLGASTVVAAVSFSAAAAETKTGKKWLGRALKMVRK